MTAGMRKATSAVITLLVLAIVVGLLLKAPTRQHQTGSTPSVLPPAPSSEDFNEAETAPVWASLPSHSRREVNAQDSYNHTRAFAEYLHQQLQHPAYQHLPYHNSQVSIQIINVTSDGRLVLDVAPLGLNVNPHTAYVSFLARYHDSGRAYLAQYGRYQP